MASTETVAVRVTVRGRVQGVWFRGWTVQAAEQLALRGWVRNRRDGSVEAMFVGPQRDVETMLQRCHRGPPAARVDALDRCDAGITAETGFHQRPTV